MRQAGVVCAMILFTASAVTAQTPNIVDKVEYDLSMKRLQGIWIPEFLITDAGLEAYPLKSRMLYISETDFARFDGGKNVQSGKFALFMGEGNAIDFQITDRLEWDLERANAIPDKPLKKQKALFKVEGDILTIAYPAPGRGRPDDLRAAAHRQVIVYKRHVDKIPEAKVPADTAKK